MKKIAIIGAGAAGLAAAVEASPRARVVMYESRDRVGSSILASGNGRCNFSNADVASSADLYNDPDFVRDVFAALPPEEVLSWFSQEGLIWREEGRGRLFPLTGKASTVLDVLRHAAQTRGVVTNVSTPVSRIERDGDVWRVVTDSSSESFDCVIVACGGKVAASLLEPTLPYRKPVAVLGPLKTDVADTAALDGIKVRGRFTIHGANGNVSQEGELLFRKYGVSGIAVFDLSRSALPGDRLSIDFLPDADRYNLDARRALHPTPTQFTEGMLLRRVADAVIARAGLAPDRNMDDAEFNRLIVTIHSFDLTVRGIGDERQCQVRRGGFSTAAVSCTTLEVLDQPGLFIVGEALDVDGPCGGFNLHWAWTTGLAAGRAAAGVNHD